MKHGADWYKREPTAYLGGVQGLSAKEHAVFSVILDLIYQHGGSVNNDPAWFAGWISDMGAAAVRTTILGLIERGKLTLTNGQLSNKRAENQAKTKENLSENRAEIGKKGGISSGVSRRGVNENKDLSEAIASPREDKRREEIKEEGKPSSKKARASRLPDDWFLPKQWGEWAVAEGCPPDAVRSESEKFKDYWHSKAGPTASKLDWQATWRNWIRQAIERTPKLKAISGGRYEPSTANNFGSPSGRGDRPDPALEQIARITGLSAASGDGGFRTGGFGEKDGPLWMGTRPQ